MEEDLKEMLGKRPNELEGETLKLFNAIMKIADERDELKLKCKELKEIEESHKQENGKLRERVKELEEENRIFALEGCRVTLKMYIDKNYIPVSLVEEKIEEYEEKAKRIAGTYQYADSGEDLENKTKQVIELRTKAEGLQELLEGK